MMECVQGEGGVLPLDKDWAKSIAKAAHDAGAIVIADEVQTGMGRTGTLLASEQYDIEADVVTLAKGIAGGVPMGACLFRNKAADVFVAGDHQSTFGGNPLACAAAKVVLETITEPSFLKEVKEKGAYIKKTVASWNSPKVCDVRGLGLMVGIQLKDQYSPVQVEKDCLAQGLLFSTAGDHTVRLVPPLNISQQELGAGLEILRGQL